MYRVPNPEYKVPDADKPHIGKDRFIRGIRVIRG